MNSGQSAQNVFDAANPTQKDALLSGMKSVTECEELAYRLLVSLPRSRLATLQRRIAPLLQFDVVGSLPTEVSLQIFFHLPYPTLLNCALVSHRWRTLSNDQSLWKALCSTRSWEWRQPSRSHAFTQLLNSSSHDSWDDSDDEGMGDSDEEGTNDSGEDTSFTSSNSEQLSLGAVASTSGSGLSPGSPSSSATHPNFASSQSRWNNQKNKHQLRHSAPSILGSLNSSSFIKPNYKLLHQTHIRLHNRLLHQSYRLSALQTRGDPRNAHTSTIYCLQLYTYPSGVQVLFTGSRDRTVREWNLSTGLVERVIKGIHDSSVLSICVHGGYVATAGSDRRVAVWDLEKNELVKVICDHEDSVLCVRFDDVRLVSCSKDRTVRTYSFPALEPQFVLGAHRAAVNAVSISQTLIVSVSGDRSIRLWDALTGKLLRTFENHHVRGIASIDFKPPFVLTGSSDKHLRLFDVMTAQGWSTSPDYEYKRDTPELPFITPEGPTLCPTCGSHQSASGDLGEGSSSGASGSGGNGVGGGSGREVMVCKLNSMHGDLVRSVALGDDFVVSGSYDLTIKVWDRKTGALVADLTGGHTGRIFCIGFDCGKIVSCGEDQRICIWDFSHGIDTSFVRF